MLISPAFSVMDCARSAITSLFSESVVAILIFY